MSMILSLLILEIFFSSSWTTRETWKEGDPMSFFFYCSAWLPSSSWKNCNSLLSRGSFSLSVYVTPVCDSYYMIFLLFFVWKSAKGYILFFHHCILFFRVMCSLHFFSRSYCCCDVKSDWVLADEVKSIVQRTMKTKEARSMSTDWLSFPSIQYCL